MNDIRIDAVNYENVASKDYNDIQVKYTGPKMPNADLYVFNIGINKYQNSNQDLNYAKPDAESFVEAIEKRSEKIFESIKTFSLYDEQATRPNIEATFKKIIESSKPTDVMVFYYAGHGSIDDTDNDEYYLIPHDVTQIYGDSAQLKAKGLSGRNLRGMLAQVKAQKQLVVLDACHSGGIIADFKGRGGASEKAIVQLARSTGFVLLAASGSEQVAKEFKDLKHGVFTYSLLEALEGKADNGDKKITVNEIKSYIDERVPQLTKQYRNKEQHPTSYMSGQDFPISIF